MNMPEVMVLLDSPLEEGDPHSFLDLVSVRDKAIQQMKFLFEMVEKLACAAFPSVSETEVGNLSGQGYKLISCNF